MNVLLKTTLVALPLLMSPVAQAGLIEDLLAIPAIQALLGRAPELPRILKRCDNAGYRQKNLTSCQQAEQASLLAQLPPEIRAIMSKPEAAASLRGLCYAAIGQPVFDSYLCAQLYQFDTSFKAQSDRLQQHNQSQQLMDRQMR